MSISYPGQFNQQFFDDNGDPLTGGFVRTYLNGTSTPRTTYNATGGANPWPIILDIAGRCALRLDTTMAYEIVVTDSLNAHPKSYPNITFESGGGMSGNYLPNSGNQTFTGNLTVTGSLDAASLSISGNDINSLFVPKLGHTGRTLLGNATAVTGAVTDIPIVDDLSSPSASTIPSTQAVATALAAGLATADAFTVKVDSGDTAGVLANKIVPGPGVAINVRGPVGTRTIEISAASENKVKVNAADTTPGYLADKLVEGPNTNIEVVGETIVISSTSTVAPDRASSTGILSFAAPFILITSTTEFSVGAMTGLIIDGSTGVGTPVSYPGAIGLVSPYAFTDPVSYVSVTIAGALVLSNTFPTPVERRTQVHLGRVVHKAGVLTTVVTNPDVAINEMSQIRDMFTPINYINNGVTPGPNGPNLALNYSAGRMFGLGANWSLGGAVNPTALDIPVGTAVTFQYRTQTDATTGNVSAVDPGYYDVAGTRTVIPGPAGTSTNQRIFISANGTIRVQYGQATYSSLALALAGAQTEAFVYDPTLRANLQLIGVLSVRKGATALNNINDARFIPVSMFGELTGGSSGSSTTTLQQAYDNSTTPEITTDDIRGALSIKRGSASDADVVLEVQNGAGVNTATVTGNGMLTLADNISLTKDTQPLITVGANTSTIPSIYINGAANSAKGLRFLTAGLSRWDIQANNGTESGTNAGSNFDITAYDDAGSVIDSPISISRAAVGFIAFKRPVDSTQNLTVSKVSTPTLTVGGNSSTGSRSLVNGAPAQNRELQFQTAGVARWRLLTNAIAEGGANAGSNLEILACTDAGATIDSPISIGRVAGGYISIKRNIDITGILFSNSGNGGVYGNTADGTDNSTQSLSSTTALSPSRGGYVTVKGNEVATTGGDVQIEAGQGTNGDIIMRTNNLERMRITKAGELQFKSAESHALRSIATAGSTTTALASDYLVAFTGTLTQTYTLPATGTTARQIIIKNRSTGGVTINRAGADTIDGGTTITLTTNHSITLVSNSADWMII